MSKLDTIFGAHRPLRIRILTLSDRASEGEYEDRGGPRIDEWLTRHFGGADFPVKTTVDIIPDDEEKLLAFLNDAREGEIDVVFTTGGTGVGPRDITPDVVTQFADRLIPGIMEHIRLKFGANNPHALISRSVAAVAGRTLIYALPGSPKAVDEYMEEILRTLDHLIEVVQGADAH